MRVRNQFSYVGNKRGFTLVELMVSIGIFGVVATISIGTLLVMIDANRKAQSVSTALTNLSFVIDNMTRNIRTGYDYHCSNRTGENPSLPSSGANQDCSGADENTIVFTDGRTGNRVGFRLYGETIQRKVSDTTDPRFARWLPVTNSTVSVEMFRIEVQNTDTYYDDGDTLQPRVLLVVSGVVNEGLESETAFNLQADVTQRVLDY